MGNLCSKIGDRIKNLKIRDERDPTDITGGFVDEYNDENSLYPNNKKAKTGDPNAGSPMDMFDRLEAIPQVDFVHGEEDEIIPISLITSNAYTKLKEKDVESTLIIISGVQNMEDQFISLLRRKKK